MLKMVGIHFKKKKNIVSSFASIVAVLSLPKIQDINVNAC